MMGGKYLIILDENADQLLCKTSIDYYNQYTGKRNSVLLQELDLYMDIHIQDCHKIKICIICASTVIWQK